MAPGGAVTHTHATSFTRQEHDASDAVDADADPTLLLPRELLCKIASKLDSRCALGRLGCASHRFQAVARVALRVRKASTEEELRLWLAPGQIGRKRELQHRNEEEQRQPWVRKVAAVEKRLRHITLASKLQAELEADCSSVEKLNASRACEPELRAEATRLAAIMEHFAVGGETVEENDHDGVHVRVVGRIQLSGEALTLRGSASVLFAYEAPGCDGAVVCNPNWSRPSRWGYGDEEGPAAAIVLEDDACAELCGGLTIEGCVRVERGSLYAAGTRIKDGGLVAIGEHSLMRLDGVSIDICHDDHFDLQSTWGIGALAGARVKVRNSSVHGAEVGVYSGMCERRYSPDIEGRGGQSHITLKRVKVLNSQRHGVQAAGGGVIEFKGGSNRVSGSNASYNAEAEMNSINPVSMYGVDYYEVRNVFPVEDDMDGFEHGGRDWSTRHPGDGSRILGVDPKLIYAGSGSRTISTRCERCVYDASS
jgi:hypothetical protein